MKTSTILLTLLYVAVTILAFEAGKRHEQHHPKEPRVYCHVTEVTREPLAFRF